MAIDGNGNYVADSSVAFNKNYNVAGDRDYSFQNSLNSRQYEFPTTSVDTAPKTSALEQAQINSLNRSNLQPTTYGGLTIGDWAGAGGLALQGYNTFFGPQKELAEKQMLGIDANIKLANQQVKANKQAMADRSQFNKTWANASNGLAASYANRIG